MHACAHTHSEWPGLQHKVLAKGSGMLKVPWRRGKQTAWCACLRRGWVALTTAVIRSSDTSGGEDGRGGAAAFCRPQSASTNAAANNKLLPNIFQAYSSRCSCKAIITRLLLLHVKLNVRASSDIDVSCGGFARWFGREQHRAAKATRLALNTNSTSDQMLKLLFQSFLLDVRDVRQLENTSAPTT